MRGLGLCRRHIFEGRKYVEEYHTSDVERELGMDRLGLICLALLLGSDYTEGVAGIGIVNAVEVGLPCYAASDIATDD